jgi:hypothetical protein
MGKIKDPKPAACLLKRGIQEIGPPSWTPVDGKPIFAPARPGAIVILSDSEDEKTPSLRQRAVKREYSQAPPREDRQHRQPSQPHIKRESSADRHKTQRNDGQATLAAAAPHTRQNQVHEPLHRREAPRRSDSPNDSPPPSDPSGSDSSDSSSGSDESDSSSDSSSSEDSSSEDETNASVYRPTTPASSIEPSPPRTRKKNGTGVHEPSANIVTESPSQRSVHNEASIRSGHAPVNFVIDLRARRSQQQPEPAARPRSHTSSAVVPESARVSCCRRQVSHGEQ